MKNHMKLGMFVGLLSVFAGYAAEMTNSRALVPVKAAARGDADQKRVVEISEKERSRLTGLLIKTLTGERDKELLNQNPSAENLMLNECQSLLAAKADANFSMTTGSPLIWAAKSHVCWPVIPLLLRAGADDTYVAKDESFHDIIATYPVQVKAYQKYIQEHIIPLLQTTGLPTVCISLIANKMGMTEQDKELWTAVYLENHAKIRELLKLDDPRNIMTKANPNVCARSFDAAQSALRRSWRKKDFESFDMLLQAGANPDKTDPWSSRTILRCLIEEQPAERAPYLEKFLPRLLQAGVDVNKTVVDCSDMRMASMPLFTYAVKQSKDLALYLGDRPHPIHQCSPFIKALLEHGKPDLTLADEKGKTALDYAEDKPETLAVLQEHRNEEQAQIATKVEAAIPSFPTAIAKVVAEYL